MIQLPDIDRILDALDDDQKAAVTHIGSNSLVIAGAGSGKTRVLTSKIAYLISLGIPPNEIMALTFTNKAAEEMRSRISDLVGKTIARGLRMGTFHSLFSRYLRLVAPKLGYTPQYTIYDTTDSKNLLKCLIDEENLDKKSYKPSEVLSEISFFKSRGLSYQDMVDDSLRMKYYKEAGRGKLPLLFQLYCDRCKKSNAMDFDDLLLNMSHLLVNDKEERDFLQNQLKYILVDEYQDTNFVQNRIIKLLSSPSTEITVVGDDAQSIYSFRGAELQNILSFEQHFPPATRFMLTKNYRSTSNIVRLANGLIAKNSRGFKKEVVSVIGEGKNVTLLECKNEYDEADKISARIERLIQKGVAPDEIAILYRNNFLSRNFESNLRKRNIRYRVLGGTSFYERKEIKDILSYLRLLVNPNDEEAFRRVYNVPARNFGEKSFAQFSLLAKNINRTLYETATSPELLREHLKADIVKKVDTFVSLLSKLQTLMRELSLPELVRTLLDVTGLRQFYEQDKSDLDRGRNIDEFLNAVYEYVEGAEEEGRDAQTLNLQSFLADKALETDIDQGEDDLPRVVLSSMHASKGLEYEYVFGVAIELGIIPTIKALTLAEKEEERRLLYVAITRAKKECTLSYAMERRKNGNIEAVYKSSFIKDLDPSLLKKEGDWAEWNAAYSTPFYYKERSRTSSSVLLKNKETRRNSDPSSIFKAGDKVRHTTLGRGVVLGFEDSISGPKIVIKFDEIGERGLISKFISLEKA